jgi:uncharacterized protein YegL
MTNPTDDRNLKCAFESVHLEFSKHISTARSKLTQESLDEYYDGVEFFATIGQGDTISIAFANVMPWVGAHFGKNSIKKITEFSYETITRSPNKEFLVDFIFSLIEVINYVKEDELEKFLSLIGYQLKETTYSVHGIHVTHSSPSFRAFLSRIGVILSQLDYEGIYEWINYGLRYFKSHPERQKAFFSLSTSDSRAIFQRQRKGVLFVDIERRANLLQLALWGTDFMYAPYSPDFEQLEHFHPYLEDGVIRLPDIYTELNGVNGSKRYLALIAHLLAHNQFTTAIVADNLSPHQRLFVEVFEDARVEYLCTKQYPGLKSIWQELIPKIGESACNEETQSCIRHRATMLSRALIDENHNYNNVEILKFVNKFKELMNIGESTTEDSLSLGLDYLANTRHASDSLADIFFTDTEISYRDDNRVMWIFIEDDDEGDDIFHKKFEDKENQKLEVVIPPHYYDEWDYKYASYKPDWTAVYERLHSHSDATFIDQLLDKNRDLAKQLKRILDLLKPQNKKRLRFQEEGSELDLDIALRSVIELKNGSQPDTRINTDFEHDSRSVSVLLLLDLSESLNDIVDSTNQTILELSQEAVSLLAWSVEQLGDNFAIAGFNSNTREQVMYYHIKGFSERWDDTVKARLANLKAEYSTRMGAAIRHGTHYLDLQKSDKKLMLILTDGEPSDVDVEDPEMLIKDTHKAVQECQQKGMYPYCISLDNKADEYISDVFGSHYSVIDRIESLPKELPQLFLSLTK